MKWNDSEALLFDALTARAELTRRLRGFFDDEGYVEVETPLLRTDVCVDEFIDPVRVPGHGFLQPSPEFAMKELLCGAEPGTAVWQLGKAFRDGERGERHHVEFTMCEWYRVGDTHHDAMTFTERLVNSVWNDGAESSEENAASRGRLSSRHLFSEIPRLCYYDVFAARLGVAVHRISDEELCSLTKGSVPEAGDVSDLHRDGLLNLLLDAVVEPVLAKHPAVFLTDYPASQAALAKTRFDDRLGVEVAERFELYLSDGNGGTVEIANGYHELTDADEMRRRFEGANARRSDPLPAESRLLQAMRSPGLPDCAGVALGWDRLVMLALGKQTLREVTVTDCASG